MKKIFNIKLNQLEIKKGKWIPLHKSFFLKNFPKVKELILKRNCWEASSKHYFFHEIDFQMFSKLKNLEILGIIDNASPITRTKGVYRNFLEILKLKKLRTLIINLDFVSTNELLKLFNKKAGVCEKFLFKYNLKMCPSEMIYEEEMDYKSWKKYESLMSINKESNFEIKLDEKDTGETSLVEQTIQRMLLDSE